MDDYTKGNGGEPQRGGACPQVKPRRSAEKDREKRKEEFGDHIESLENNFEVREKSPWITLNVLNPGT